MARYKYITAADAIADLQARGYEYDFSLAGNQLLCCQQNLLLKTIEFNILEMYYFRRKGRKYEEKIIYAIGASDYCMQGILLITANGNNTLFPTMINEKLRYRFTRNSNLAGNGIL